ncbi:hypothetical protein [Sediminibacterium ginsengisoli]|uniref:YD repeat-containing protein n=1 Tax=Sediminibacterium ginsengisoli TaxID=413434 RepID=A0A1T4QIW4_9BACT|nr:hypothetical protein [Sediminibacterium ginsengisoli]SKA03577.1 YD repeat-containing protein [Sediminibacterium ginsengisoli]
MKALNIACCMLCSLVLASCEKTFTLTNPGAGSGSGGGTSNNGSGNTPGLLLKTETISSGGTSTVTYDYDASDRLIKQTSYSSVSPVIAVMRFVRDNNGRIIEVKSNAMPNGLSNPTMLTGTDSITIKVHYPSATSTQFDYSVYTATKMGIAFTDSVVYKYTANQLVDITEYNDLFGPSSVVSSMTYTYDANGNVKQVQNTFTQGAGAPPTTVTYDNTFDTQKSPLILGNDGLIGGGSNGQACGPNNMIKAVINIPGAGPQYQNQVSTVTYQYNNDGKPASASYSNPVLGTSTIKFYYK